MMTNQDSPWSEMCQTCRKHDAFCLDLPMPRPQWRHGCEVEQDGDEVKFSKGISELDGEDLMFFDIKESQWVATVDAALPTKRKWDNVPILNQYTKGYLEKECVDWFNKFREYADGCRGSQKQL
ncbi:MHC class I antigen [Labeo rohita]|uniref:MHC class I antigen n=1 Tax=Labeo rohita TaxID=84645 RepID=A0A498LFS0_LABRO|nr:MHC class I antigen [Labeo rohita]